MVIAKRTRLRRATTRARERIPTRRRVDVRLARSWKGIDHSAAATFRQVDHAAGCRAQWNRWDLETRQVTARAIIDGHGQVRRQLMEVVASGHGDALPVPTYRAYLVDHWQR